MPGVPNKNQQISIVQDTNPLPQPRQPANLQGLLRYAVEAQGNTPGPVNDVQPLHGENRQFLEEALKSMTVDIIALMRTQIETLQRIDASTTEDDLGEKVGAFETILDYVSNIDVANDFHKINGFSIFEPCLACKFPEIRAYACDTIAEISQNNPYIQQVICETTNLIKTLLNLCQSEPEDSVIIKALYAISCISRDYELGYKNLRQHNGLEVLKETLSSRDNSKICIKITFLLTSLCSLDDKLVDALILLDFNRVLIGLLQNDWCDFYEHILALLHLIVEQNVANRKELKKNPHLQGLLKKHADFIKGKDEFKEAQIYCENILKLVF